MSVHRRRTARRLVVARMPSPVFALFLAGALSLAVAVLALPIGSAVASPAPLALSAAGASAAASSSEGGALPAHPRQLKYGELKFEVPKADKYRYQLKNGIVAYVAEDRTLPLVQMQVLLRVGDFLEPAGKTGVAALTATMLRKGGTASLTAEQFDEKADFLAAQMGAGGGDEQSTASLNAITNQLEPSLDLFFEMLKSPRFQENRIEIEKGNILESMKQRNDDASSILGREWDWLLYGMEHFSTRRAVQSELAGITRQDLVDFHSKYWRPQNMILAISGDVDTKKFLAGLETRFADLKKEGPKVPWPPAGPTFVPKPGLYHVEKDIPQGKVAIGHLSFRRQGWENPDYFALAVMNDVLGGGGFTSRIMSRVRSDEGLAYGAGSSFEIGDYWPGEFEIGFASKNPTVAYAAKIAIEEMKKIRETPVTDSELTTSKNSFIETFPQNFDSASKIVSTFAQDEFLGRPHSYWQTYRENVRKVTGADVQRVAQTYLQPDKLVFLVVGKWSEIEPGDANGKATMKDFYGGQVKHIPLRDPLTLKPMN